MSRIRFPFWFLLILLSLWSCRKDQEQFQPYAPTAEELGSILGEHVPGSLSHTVFTLSNLATDKILETPNGSRIFLIDTDHLFANASTGAPVLCSTCPDLKIEITEVLDKSDIIARGLNTASISGALFESGGMVRVKATCNGELLTLLPDRNLKIQFPNDAPESGFFVFKQTESSITVPQWANTSQEVFEAEWPIADGTTQQGYELLVRNLGWSACGRLLTDASSPFCIELPAGFADQNTLAYIVFKNQFIVAPLQFDLGANQFCYFNAPEGYLVQLVALSKLGDQYWLGKAQTEIGTNAKVALGTQQMTEEAVLDFVKGL